MDTRQCIVCKIVKPLTEFYVSKHQAGGYRYECKACAKAHTIATRKVRVQRPTPELPVEKHCPRCHLTLPAEAFSIDLGNASGLRTHCKRCASALALARYYKQPLAPTPPCDECLRLQSERGRTVEVRPVAERFWAFVDTSAGPEACWPWTGGLRKGYGAFGVRKDLVVQAHRFAWELTYGPIPEGLNVLHHCDNPPCCNLHPKHLFVGTFQDNSVDMVLKHRHYQGQFPPGTKRPRTKITREEAQYIRSRKGLETSEALAQQFQIHQRSIQGIWSGLTWKE